MNVRGKLLQASTSAFWNLQRTGRVQRRNDEAPCADRGSDFRICGPKLTGQGLMRRDIILLGGGCFFLVDLEKGLFPKSAIC